MNETSTPGMVGSMAGLGPDAEFPARDTHRGGSSYEASMLRNLLARIHRDGGHYVEEYGLDQALEDADSQVVQWLAMQDHLTMLCKPHRVPECPQCKKGTNMAGKCEHVSVAIQ